MNPCISIRRRHVNLPRSVLIREKAPLLKFKQRGRGTARGDFAFLRSSSGIAAYLGSPTDQPTNQPTNVQRSEAKSAAGAGSSRTTRHSYIFPSFQDEPGSGDPVGDRPRRRLRRGGVLRGVHLQRVVTPAIPLAK